MTRDLRWRILTLQVIVTIVFAFSAGVCYWAHGFTHDQVSSQLSSQQIVFPAANSAAIKALPAADQAAMIPYAGQTMTTGDQAHAWAEHFMAVHLSEMGGTYDQYSTKAMAEQSTNPTKYAADENMVQTVFRGDTLRSLLNQAWAFWFVGDIALYAGIGLTVAAIAVFCSMLFELFIAKPKTA